MAGWTSSAGKGRGLMASNGNTPGSPGEGSEHGSLSCQAAALAGGLGLRGQLTVGMRRLEPFDGEISGGEYYRKTMVYCCVRRRKRSVNVDRALNLNGSGLSVKRNFGYGMDN